MDVWGDDAGQPQVRWQAIGPRAGDGRGARRRRSRRGPLEPRPLRQAPGGQGLPRHPPPPGPRLRHAGLGGQSASAIALSRSRVLAHAVAKLVVVVVDPAEHEGRNTLAIAGRSLNSGAALVTSVPLPSGCIRYVHRVAALLGLEAERLPGLGLHHLVGGRPARDAPLVGSLEPSAHRRTRGAVEPLAAGALGAQAAHLGDVGDDLVDRARAAPRRGATPRRAGRRRSVGHGRGR